MSNNEYIVETVRFLKQLTHITIAVVDENGLPWAVPVKVQKWDGRVIEWFSRTDSRHSQAIAANPGIAMTAFASHTTEWDEIGIYIEAQVTKVDSMGEDMARYTATMYKVWHNNADHVKREVDIQQLSF